MACSKEESKKVRPLPVVQEGERVLTFHGPMLREAECIRAVVEDRQVKYLVRYQAESGPSGEAAVGARVHPSDCGGGGALPSTSSAGAGAGASATEGLSEELRPIACWHYEWIPESRVLRYCHTLGKEPEGSSCSSTSSSSDVGQHEASATASSATTWGAWGPASQASEWEEGWGSGATGGGEGGRGRDDDVAPPPPPSSSHRRPLVVGAPERRVPKKREVKVPLPDALKPLLVRDWELVTQDKKLFTLPAHKPVDAILAEFSVFQQHCGVASKEYATQELVAGIREYFNVLLGSQLLYKFERPQYTEILGRYPGCPMSQIYGGAHLLRLFVQLGSALTYSGLDEHSLDVLLSHLQDFLEYLAAKPALLFTPADYQLASAEYQL
ncbi:mortality factor 4-like protein 2, partial [Gracilinanus agilis]|uniref:mortality factor 4-like protein 2 n=1 Tax=Gracilinanus agilis TaxID=191870 RepID=UPI001CFC7EEF